MSDLFQPATTWIIRNPVSGRPRTRRAARRVAALLECRGYHAETTRGAGHGTELARAAVRARCRSVIAMGGDGTLLETIAALPADVAIGFFPTGTVNLFALGLRIPRDERGWVALLESGQTRSVYFGLCGERPFASVASVGFDAAVVARVSPGLKKLVQEGAYVWQGLRDLPGYRIPRYDVRLDGTRWEGASLAGVLIGKGPHYGGARSVFPHADHGRDRLEVALLTGGRRDILRYAWGVRTGRLADQPGVHLRTVEELTVDSHPGSLVQLDGDADSRTPARFACETRPRVVLAPSR